MYILHSSIANYLLEKSANYKLENDPMCGITTGGAEDCFWDCQIENSNNGLIIQNPECLIDCFEEVYIVENNES